VTRLAAALLAALALAAPAGAASPDVFSGLGTWLDIYAGPIWTRAPAVVAAAKEDGVTTIYLETSNYRRSDDVVSPAQLGSFVDAAHAAGLKVVAWYLPGFERPTRDARRALAAIRFRSPSGQRFDGFALDIEASVVRDVSLRNARLLALARRLRSAAGAAYPLGAIVPSPVGMRRHPTYWPRFPFRALAGSFDAFLPMAYFSYYAKTPQAAYAYARDVVTEIRLGTGLPDVPIHVIGGSTKHMRTAPLAGFVRAVSASGVQGISLYAFPQTSAANWATLRSARLD
jgi:hypothetical protein